MTSSEHPYIHAKGHVLAAIDQSTYSESVCRYAIWAAERLSAPLDLVHVLGRPEPAAPLDLSGSLALGEQESLLMQLSALDEQRGKLSHEQGRLLLEQARRLAAEAGLSRVDLRLRNGGLVDTLTELEKDVRVFVLGKRGEHADFAKEHLGSELERVVRAVHRPLLVASREFRPVKRVLVAFDNSATTRKGVEMVAASPLFRGLEVQMVTVGGNDAIRTGLEWAEQTLAAAGFSVSSAVLDGDAGEAIVEYVSAREIDMLVMGAYGHSRIRRLIVGSTTTEVLQNCRIPVLLLR